MFLGICIGIVATSLTGIAWSWFLSNRTDSTHEYELDYQKEIKLARERELADFDEQLRYATGKPLPWDPPKVAASYQVLLAPGLLNSLYDQQQQYARQARTMDEWLAQQDPMRQQQAAQIQNISNTLGNAFYGNPGAAIANALGGLLGETSRPSRPE